MIRTALCHHPASQFTQAVLKNPNNSVEQYKKINHQNSQFSAVTLELPTTYTIKNPIDPVWNLPLCRSAVCKVPPTQGTRTHNTRTISILNQEKFMDLCIK